jgi:hypothetical protein
MADHFYGINVGGGLDPSAVTFGAASAGSDIELRVRDGVAGMDKMKIDSATWAIISFIERANAPA